MTDGAPRGYAWRERKSGEIEITHGGLVATTLRGRAAAEFRNQIGCLDAEAAQQRMARVTGHYRHGNERAARGHRRNAG